MQNISTIVCLLRICQSDVKTTSPRYTLKNVQIINKYKLSVDKTTEGKCQFMFVNKIMQDNHNKWSLKTGGFLIQVITMINGH